MAHLAIRFNCRDYAAWKQVFDEVAPQRRAAGEIEYHIYHVDGDLNNIMLVDEWDSLDNIKAWVASDFLREAMERAGVEGPPTIYFLTAGDSGKP